MRHFNRFILFVGACAWSATFLQAADWNQFRGPNGSGKSNESDKAAKMQLANRLTLDDVVWKIDSGKGGSSLVAWQDKLFLTSYEKETRTLKCFSAADGKELWAKSISKLRKETATPPNDPAMCTPVCNERFVCAWFPDAGMIACSHYGDLVWQKTLGLFIACMASVLRRCSSTES